jgi:hypothetical protein
LFPLAFLSAALRQCERERRPGCVYLHPWEVDPDQPRQRLGGLRGFRHYVNLRKTWAKLDRLLARHQFAAIGSALAASPSCVAKWPAYSATALLA